MCDQAPINRTASNFGHHVTYIRCYFPYLDNEWKSGHSFNQTADLTIGTALVLSSLLGIAGNLSAFAFFCKNRNKKLHLTLFIMTCVTDLCTSIFALPIAPSLFNKRLPTLFGNYIFCGIWALVFHFRQSFSTFIVLLLNVTRCITIFSPFYRINKIAVMRACVGFGGLLLTMDFIYTWSGGIGFVYRSYDSSCDVGPPGSNWTYYLFVLPTIVLVMSLVVLFSFLVIIGGLIAGKGASSDNDKKIKEDTVTVVLFTALFLICNMPRFILVFLKLCIESGIWPELEDTIKNSPTLFWYRTLASQVLFCIVSSLFNLILYAIRFEKFRKTIVNFERSTVEPISVRRARRGKSSSSSSK